MAKLHPFHGFPVPLPKLSLPPPRRVIGVLHPPQTPFIATTANLPGYTPPWRYDPAQVLQLSPDMEARAARAFATEYAKLFGFKRGR